MATTLRRVPVAFTATLLLVVFFYSSLIAVGAGESSDVDPKEEDKRWRGGRPFLFNFGDSNSDTGGLIDGLGYYLGPPRGRTFFNRSTGRWGDGRLIIDFLCERVNAKYLSPYLNSFDPDFINGVNFAVAGAATLPRFVPFNLNIQLLQYGHFRNRTREHHIHGESGVTRANHAMISEKEFRDALYMFDIGQNDLSFAFTANQSLSQIRDKIPLMVAEIKEAIKGIYELGGTKFWVHNTGPLGCLPQKLAMFRIPTTEHDQCGCLASFNDAARVYNTALSSLCTQLRQEMSNATIVYTDVFRIEYDLICNHTKYGFEDPLTACCGYGGPPYNYNNTITCGVPGYTACPATARHISWDGVHYMEVANKFITSQILSARYSEPAIKFESFFHRK